MKFQAVIFDLDGTIIDTQKIWKTATRDLISAHGTKISNEKSEEIDRILCGKGMHESCLLIKNQFKIKKTVEELVSEKKKIACNLYSKGLRFVKGFKSFHKKVLDLNLKTGIATSSARETLNSAKAQLKLELYFGNHIYDIKCVNNKPKPDPEIFLYTAKKLGIRPELCMVIEDSSCGITAAQKAGMFCIGINTYGERDLINHADCIVDYYDQINLKSLLERK